MSPCGVSTVMLPTSMPRGAFGRVVARIPLPAMGCCRVETAPVLGLTITSLTPTWAKFPLPASTLPVSDSTKMLPPSKAAMRAGETVGILMDTNMTPPQGIFVDFFGIPACTASGLARIALRTDAAVVPGFTIWDPASQKYRLRFDPALELVRTGDLEADIAANTRMFTKVIEDYVRKYPDQWLWVHRRWKTRPEGQPPLY